MQRGLQKRHNWQLAPLIPNSVRKQLREFHPVLAQVLFNRGFDTAQDARQFLTGEFTPANSFALSDMNKAVGRIRQAIQKKEQIAVYGDFDADGVTATALLMQTLIALGANVTPYIPHRVEDGYGLNTSALHNMAQDGFKLVITVDCGIRDVQPVLDAGSHDLDIIITDHHSVGTELPPALAIVNPKRQDCDYPEDMLAGVGVAFHLADALLKAAESAGEHVRLDQEDLLDLVAIGTITDLVPMNRAENRYLVQQGLRVLNAARRPGLHALIDRVGLRPGRLKSSNIGFGLGPRLNAAGRMEDAILAYELLTTTDYARAEDLAEQLNELNMERQVKTREAQSAARKQALEGMDISETYLLFAADKDYLPGIVGLIAGRLAEEFYRPAVAVQIDANGECHGSCRSIPEFNVVHALDQCADLLVRHGGHAQAAGFTVRHENLQVLRERLFELAYDALRERVLLPTLDVDAEVPMESLTLGLAETLVGLEPFGNQNPSPLLVTYNVPVKETRRVGRDGAHLKMTLGEGSFRLDAIAFRFGELDKERLRRVDLVYHLEVNEWNGRRRPQLNIKDIRPAE